MAFEFEYQTERLLLKVLDGSSAAEVLRFYYYNRDIFEPYESTKPSDFYTFEGMKNIVNGEFNVIAKGHGVRYYLFLKNDPRTIVGTVSFSHLHDNGGWSCAIGYKLDRDYIGYGYAFEACSFLIPTVMESCDVMRIIADIMPSNADSLRLIDRLGFTFETVAKQSHNICGKNEDHLRYAILREDVLGKN